MKVISQSQRSGSHFTRRLLMLLVLLLASRVNAQTTFEFSTIDATGIDALEEAYRALDIQIKITSLPARRALKQANKGVVDGELLRIKGIDKKYKNLIMLPVPIYRMELVAFTGNGTRFSVDGWSSLRPHYTAILAGMKIAEKKIQGENYTAVVGVAKLFRLVAKQRVDLGLFPRVNVYQIIQRMGIQNIEVLEPAVQVVPLYHYLHKKHSKLVPQLTEILERMQAQGRIEELMQAVKERTRQAALAQSQ